MLYLNSSSAIWPIHSAYSYKVMSYLILFQVTFTLYWAVANGCIKIRSQLDKVLQMLVTSWQQVVKYVWNVRAFINTDFLSANQGGALNNTFLTEATSIGIICQGLKLLGDLTSTASINPIDYKSVCPPNHGEQVLYTEWGDTVHCVEYSRLLAGLLSLFLQLRRESARPIADSVSLRTLPFATTTMAPS